MSNIALPAPRVQARPTRLRRLIRWLVGDLRAALAIFVLLVLVIVAIGAPWIAPYAPTAQDVNNMLAPPGAGHLLGTDDLGRDIFSRLIYGAPATVYASLLAVSVAVTIGLPVGLIAGFFGGWMPRPRKLRLASASSAAASSSVTWTMTGGSEFGSTCFQRICHAGAPKHLEAST